MGYNFSMIIKSVRESTIEKVLNKDISDLILEIFDYSDCIEYQCIKWKCEKCNRWNYELTFLDNSGAWAICDYCLNVDEF